MNIPGQKKKKEQGKRVSSIIQRHGSLEMHGKMGNRLGYAGKAVRRKEKGGRRLPNRKEGRIGSTMGRSPPSNQKRAS